jgi:hypothetical protein
MPHTVLDDHIGELRVEVLGDLEAHNKVEASVKIELLAKIRCQNEIRGDLQVRGIGRIPLHAEDLPPSAVGQRTQPSAGAAAKIEHRARIDKATQDIGDRDRGVPDIRGKALVFRDGERGMGLIHRIAPRRPRGR